MQANPQKWITGQTNRKFIVTEFGHNASNYAEMKSPEV